MQKSFTFILLFLLLANFPHLSMAADAEAVGSELTTFKARLSPSGSGINPHAYSAPSSDGEGAGGSAGSMGGVGSASAPRAEPAAAGAGAAATRGGLLFPAGSLPVLPPIEMDLIMGYLREIPMPAEKIAPTSNNLGLRDAEIIDRINYRNAHIYGSVGTVLAAVAAEHTTIYTEGTVLTAAMMAAANLPPVFVGWKVIKVYDGINRGRPVVPAADSVLKDTFDSKNTNMFGIALEAPATDTAASAAGGGVAPFRWAFFNTFVPPTLQDLLLGMYSVLREGDPSIAEWRDSIRDKLGVSSATLNKILPLFPDPLPVGADDEMARMIAGRKFWAVMCARKFEEFLIRVKPDGIGANSIAAALLSSMIRGYEGTDDFEAPEAGSLTEMVKRIQYRRWINAGGNDFLVESLALALHGGSPIEPRKYINKVRYHKRTDEKRFKDVYLNRVGADLLSEAGAKFGEEYPLPERPKLFKPRILVSAVPAVVAVPTPPAPVEDTRWFYQRWLGIGAAPTPVRVTTPAAPATGFWAWVASAFTTARTEADDVTPRQLQEEILKILGPRGAMVDILLILRELHLEEMARAGGGARGDAGAGALVPAPASSLLGTALSVVGLGGSTAAAHAPAAHEPVGTYEAIPLSDGGEQWT